MDIDLAEMGFESAAGIIKKESTDVLILDEVLRAVEYNLISEKKLISLLIEKPQNLEIILTGNKASKEIISISDSVIYLFSIKQPFKSQFEPSLGKDF